MHLLDRGRCVEVISLTLTPHTDLVAVAGAAVVVANVYTRAERRIEGVDTVGLKGRAAAVHAIGDCVAPRGVHQAILEGTRVARLV
jgi:hypothetical protein